MNIYLNNRIYEGLESIEDRFANYYSIICNSPHPFKDGQAVVEGVDYEKRWQRNNLSGDWVYCTESEFIHHKSIYRRIVALPIEKYIEQEGSLYKHNVGPALPIEDASSSSSSSTDKELTPLGQLIEELKKLSPEPGDTDASKGFHEGVQWAIIKATRLLEAERKMAALIYKDGCIEGLSAFDNPLKFFDDYFNSKYKQ